MKTLLLDRTPWDLALDSAGNIALASEPYSQVQDVASACRLFEGELYYDTSKGAPFFAQNFEPNETLNASLVRAAKTVPGVSAANIQFTRTKARIGGTVSVTIGGAVTTAVF